MKIEIKIILDYEDGESLFDGIEKRDLIRALDYFTDNLEIPVFSFIKPEQTYEVKEII